MEIPKVFKLFGIMSLVCIAALSMVSSAIAQPDICRDLPGTAAPGDTITVNLDITLDDANKTVIEENAPEDWTISNPTNNGSLDDINRVSWIDPDAEPSNNQLSYEVTIPENAASGVYNFEGEFSLVVGEKLKSINCDNQIVINEDFWMNYDGDNSGTIEKSEVMDAINDYFASITGEEDNYFTDDPETAKPQVMNVINKFFADL